MRMLLLRTNKVKSSVKNSFIGPKRALITAVIALGITAMTKLRPLPYSIKSIKGARLLAVLVALFLFSQIFQMAGVGWTLKNSKWIANADTSPFTRQQPTNCSTCKRPSTDHYLNFAYFSEDEDMTSTLTLNNNKNEATVVEITIFNSKGEPFRLAPISLASKQVSRLSVRELTKDARGDFKSGNIQVFYHGPAMSVTGQVTITSIKEHISFESSPTEAMMFTSTRLDGIVWVPDEKTKASVALTNTASSPITVTASSGRDSQGRQKVFTLEPRETQVLNLNEFVDRQKGLPSAALVSLTHSGAAGDLITTGFALNDKTGFACNVNFVDRSGTKSNRLAGAHLRFGSARPEEGFPSGTTFQSPLVIANAGDLPSEVKIAVDYTVNDLARRVELEPLTLAALAVKQIDLAQEMAQRGVVDFVDNAGVDISYTGAAGSVIGRLTSVDTTGDFSFEVPIKDPLAGMNRVSGSYPWRLDQGYNTVLHLKNTIDKEVNALIQIRYNNGTYNPELIKLAPYQTVALDIKRMRDEQKKDIRGGAMPKDVTSGQLIWYEQTVGSLIGRAEVFNAKAGVSSSFSCAGNCPCPPDFFQAFMSTPSYIGEIGESGQFFLPLEIKRDCDMIEYGPFEISGNDWLSTNSSIAEVTSPGGLVSCVGVGNANIIASFASTTYEYDIGEVCIPHTTPTMEVSGSMTVAKVTLAIDGVADSDKTNVGGLVVRNNDNNGAPRQKITIQQVQPNTMTGNVILTRTNGAKVKVFNSSSGGTEITFNGTNNKFSTSSLPMSLYVEGANYSDSMRDITFTLSLEEQSSVSDSAAFTTLWVDQPVMRFSGAMSLDNDKRNNYKNWTVASTFDLGPQKYNILLGARVGWGSEAGAAVHPNNFNYPSNDLRLERDNEFHDWIDNGASTIGSPRSFSSTIPPGNDTGPADAMDNDPAPNGVIYDFDAAGLAIPNSPQNQIRRTRNNFKAFASITNNGKLVRCSQVASYFIRFSMKQLDAPSGTNWVLLNPVDVTNDNQTGTGTTSLTWNLQ